jgi:indolepyruvate ferredoxin oxidoreductase beta subunit
LEENEAYRCLPYLAGKGSLYANATTDLFPSPHVNAYLHTADIACHAANASDIAFSLGAPMSSNLALLGFFAAFGEGPLTPDEIRASIDEASPDRFKAQNIKVFEAGLEEGRLKSKNKD